MVGKGWFPWLLFLSSPWNFALLLHTPVATRERSWSSLHTRLQTLSWELWNMEQSLSDWEDYRTWPPSAWEIWTPVHFYKWDFTTILQFSFGLVWFLFKCSLLFYFVINSILPKFFSALGISEVPLIEGMLLWRFLVCEPQKMGAAKLLKSDRIMVA